MDIKKTVIDGETVHMFSEAVVVTADNQNTGRKWTYSIYTTNWYYSITTKEELPQSEIDSIAIALVRIGKGNPRPMAWTLEDILIREG